MFALFMDLLIWSAISLPVAFLITFIYNGFLQWAVFHPIFGWGDIRFMKAWAVCAVLLTVLDRLNDWRKARKGTNAASNP